MTDKTRCSEWLRTQGKPYPRTCHICGIGRCTLLHNEPDEEARTEQHLKEIAIELIKALKMALDTSWNGPMPDYAREKARAIIAKSEQWL